MSKIGNVKTGHSDSHNVINGEWWQGNNPTSAAIGLIH